MQIYENNMQISVVLVSQYKQTNDGKDFDSVPQGESLTGRVAQVWVCACVDMSQGIRVHAHVCVTRTHLLGDWTRNEIWMLQGN